MEFVLRALNEYDILCDPINNGIASKKMLFDLTRRHLEAKEGKFLEGLSSKEREEYIKSYIPKYIKTHRNKLRKRFEYGNRAAREVINSFVKNKDNESYFMLLQYLSTLNNHLANGSRVDTEWISTSTNFDSMMRYYDFQPEHKVAACLVSTNGVYNSSTFVVDLSEKERVEQLRCLGKKMDIDAVRTFIEFADTDDPKLMENARKAFHKYYFMQTDKRFRGYSFANNSHEIAVYNHLEPGCVKSILEQLHIDLVLADRFNTDFIALPIEEQKRALIDMKERLKKQVMESNSDFIKYVFEELYLKNKNIDFISKDENEKGRILNIRNQIISRAVEVPSVLIKK